MEKTEWDMINGGVIKQQTVKADLEDDHTQQATSSQQEKSKETTWGTPH